MRTYLVKLETDEVSKGRVLKTLCSYREIWNFCSEQFFMVKHGGLKTVHDLCYTKARQKFPEVPSQIVIKAEQAIVSCYHTIARNKHKISQPPILQNPSLQLDQRIYKIIGNTLSMTAIGGPRIKLKILWYPRIQNALKNAMADPKIFERRGQLWMAVPCHTPKPPITQTSCIGVDLGLNRAIFTTEGNES